MQSTLVNWVSKVLPAGLWCDLLIMQIDRFAVKLLDELLVIAAVNREIG
jgi:hypothetical protein